MQLVALQVVQGGSVWYGAASSSWTKDSAYLNKMAILENRSIYVDCCHVIHNDCASPPLLILQDMLQQGGFACRKTRQRWSLIVSRVRRAQDRFLLNLEGRARSEHEVSLTLPLQRIASAL